MNVKVSRTVKTLYGRNWRKEVGYLIAAMLTAPGRKPKAAVTLAQITITVEITKHGATVTATPDFLPDQEEYAMDEDSMP
jgi:hypothetical protein